MYPVIQQKSSASVLQDRKLVNAPGEVKVWTTHQTALTVLPREHAPSSAFRLLPILSLHQMHTNLYKTTQMQ